jgi:hypothetical protein
MPLEYFICPDGVKRPITECLEKCPCLDGRCLSLPTLTTIGSIRRWSGVPSTTQLLNPTRLEYLSIKYPFAVDPFDQAFSLLGTRHHGKLEIVAKKIEGLIAEQKLTGEITGILDLLEPLNDDEYRLIDYKTYGSYSVAKHLGLKEGGETDQLKLALQTNNYRIMAKEIGFNVTEIKCQITVRDGGTYSAKQNGIDRNLYLLPVEILPDDYVKEYFLTKSFALINAVEQDKLPELCPYEERWGNRRCLSYCAVNMYCPEGAKVSKLEYEGEE